MHPSDCRTQTDPGSDTLSPGVDRHGTRQPPVSYQTTVSRVGKNAEMKENALAGSCARSQGRSGIRSHRCVESIGRNEVAEAGLWIGRIR